MNNMVLLFKNLHWLLPTSFVVSFSNLFIGDWIFLSLPADMGEILQLGITFGSLVLLILGAKYTLGDKRSTYVSARDKVYMERVEFLKENGFITAMSTKKDIDRVIAEHFGEGL